MNEKLEILLCDTFRFEAESILKQGDLKDIQFSYYPCVCTNHGQDTKIDRIVEQKILQKQENLMVFSCFRVKLPDNDVIQENILVNRNCFYCLASEEFVDSLINDRGYLLTPGWLKLWKTHIENWGFDQETASMFFAETAKSLILLNSLNNPESLKDLEEFSKFLNIPYKNYPIGLNYFKLLISKILLEWKERKNKINFKTKTSDYNKKMAEYSMAFDLLTSLARSKSEDDAIIEISDMFTMLFSAGKVSYFPIVSGQICENKLDCDLSEEERSDLRRWVFESDQEYFLNDSNNGFCLRIQHRQRTLGVINISNLALPDRKEEYVNLAVSLSRLCGLVLSNARDFQKLQEAEKIARSEKEVSEILQKTLTDLTSELEHKELLSRIFVSLSRVIPFSTASIGLIKNDSLVFDSGISQSEKGVVSFVPEKHVHRLDEIEMGNTILVIPDIKENNSEIAVFQDNYTRSWMGIPLIQSGKQIGLLTIGSSQIDVYTERDIDLAKGFANQATIAIENARLFDEVRKLANTDALTDIFNRRFFYREAHKEFLRSVRYKRPLSMVMFDVDHFKRVNDKFGHLMGDEVLRNIAKIGKDEIRGSDLFGRYGGEEFVLLLPETTLENARIISERLRKNISEMETFSNTKEEIRVTVSLGIACLDSTCEKLEDLLDHCDEALYDAKRMGRNCVRNWMSKEI